MGGPKDEAPGQGQAIDLVQDVRGAALLRLLSARPLPALQPVVASAAVVRRRQWRGAVRCRYLLGQLGQPDISRIKLIAPRLGWRNAKQVQQLAVLDKPNRRSAGTKAQYGAEAVVE